MTETQKVHNGFKFDRSLFHKLSLLPFFAFVGLGADSVSSSCYGPEEAFLSLGPYTHLSVFVGLMAIITIWVISTSYCHIIDLFPYGGGGYVVASKLLSPLAGLVSGAALLVDYVLTITISVASGVDAIFSVLPHEHQVWKFVAKIATLAVMMLLNLRGIKESVFPWIPVFFLFAFSHIFAFIWAFASHFGDFNYVINGVSFDAERAVSSVGIAGFFFIILKSYSVGAGTYTGIEAVSNGMNIFREPRAHNAKLTMLYMSIALAVTVTGLILSYLLYGVEATAGKTLNGVLMGHIGHEMGPVAGSIFSAITLFSESALLIMAAQSGFLGGPRVLANMASDRWLPNRFTNLSDRFVMRHGILLISAAAFALMAYSEGSVSYLVVLYSLAVFITFTMSQLGMVRHWARERFYNRKWLRGIIVNGIGFALTLFVLISLTLIKFEEGAWLTLLVIACLVCLCRAIKSYYDKFTHLLTELTVDIPPKAPSPVTDIELVPSMHSVVIFVSGITNLALQSIAQTIKLFGTNVESFVFVHVGIINAGTFKGESEVRRLEEHTHAESQKLVKYMQKLGYRAESFVSVGLDIGDEVANIAKEIHEQHPSAIFVGGQLILAKETLFSIWMHNQTLYTIQRRLYELEYPFVTIPIYIGHKP